MRQAACLAAFVILLLNGCGELPARHPALAAASLSELLPVRAFVANTDFNGGYRISPDGAKIAWIGVHRFRPAVFVKSVGQDDARAMSPFSPDFRWAGGRHLLMRRDRNGDENFHVWLVDTESSGAPPVDLTPLPGTRAEINAVAPDGRHVLIAHNGRDPHVFDLHRVDIASASMTLVAQNPGDVVSWIADAQAVLRGRVRYRGESHWLELADGANWKTVYSWTARDTVDVLGIDPGSGRIWLRSNRGRDKVALVSLSAVDGRESVFHEDPDVDVVEAGMSEASGQPLYALSHPDYPRLEIFDRKLRDKLLAWRAASIGADPKFLGMEILGKDAQEENFVIGIFDHTGKRYWLWKRASGTGTQLGSDALHPHAKALAEIRPVAFDSRDGLPLRGYLTLPRGAAPHRLPMVLLVHGGPWARNTWADADFLADALRVQFLANRGYAVLQVNFRGSTGYGRRHFEAAIGEFGGAMQDDLLDAVDWAIREGVADPDHVAIMGASYGGYATLSALTRYPQKFACGLDLFGPSDLVSLLEDFPPYWRSGLPLWHRFVGNPAVPEDRRRLEASSPLAWAASVERPLLIIQGTGDVRSAVSQSDRMAEALRAAGKPVEYVRISGMGHGTWHWPHNLRIYRKTEDFLGKCLGGRSSGFDVFELAAWAL